MAQKEQQSAFVMRRSRWGSVSIIGFFIFGILLPAVMLTHVFVDYVAYVGGYAKYAKSTVESSIAAQTQEIEALNGAISKANEDISEIEAAIAELEKEIKDLTTQRTQKQSDKDAQASKTAKLQNELNALTQELNKLETDKALLEQAKETLQVNLTNAQNAAALGENALKGAENAVKEAEIALLQAKKSVLEQTIDGLDEYEVDARKEVNATIEGLVAELAALKAEIVQKNTTIDENKVEMKRLEYEEMNPNLTAVKDVKAQLEKISETVKKLQAVVSENDQKITAAKKEIKNLETQITNTKPSIGDYAILLVDFDLQIKEVEKEYNQYKEEYEQIKADPTATFGQAKPILEKLNAAAEKLETLKTARYETQEKFDAAYKTRKEQEKQIEGLNQTIAALEEIKAEKNAELSDHLEGENTYSVSYLNGLIKDYQAKADAAKKKIDDLAKSNTKLDNEIKKAKQTIEEKTAQKIAAEKVLNGLDAEADAAKIAELAGQIQALDEQIAKWQTNKLQANTSSVAAYTGEEFTLKQQAEKAAVEALNARKSELKTAQDNAKAVGAAVTKAQADLSANEAEIEAQTTAYNDKEKDVNGKQAALTESQSKEGELETAIQTLTKSIETKNASKQSEQEEKTRLTEELVTKGKALEASKARKNELQELLKGKSSALLAAEDVAMITAYEKDKLFTEKPYRADAANAGLLTTTKLMFESMNMNMDAVGLLSYMLAVLGVLLLVVVVISTITKTKKVKSVQYEVYENVIQCRMGEVLGKRFALEHGATVRTSQSLKGKIFGYGSLTVSRGSGLAGEFTMRKIKSVHRMKSLLQATVARLPKEEVQETQQQPFFPMPPFPPQPMYMPMPFPVPMQVEDEEEFEPCDYE